MKNIYGIFEDSPSKTLPKDLILLYEGDEINKLYYIQSGYVKVYIILDSGSEHIIFVYGPGDIFPFTSYLSSSRTARYFYECMTTIKTRAMVVEDFEQHVRGNIGAGEALLTYTATIGNQFIRRIDILSVNNARRKIIALLAFLVEKAGSKDNYCRLDIPLTNQDIADMCGLTRETTSIHMGHLRKKGLVSGARNLIVNNAELSKIKAELAISP